MIKIDMLFKNDLDKLWVDTCSSVPYHHDAYDKIKRGYAIVNEIEEKSILFVGMNPSFSDKKDAWNNGNRGGNILYNIPKPSEKKETNSFFIKINDFYKCIIDPKPPLAHHDLLFIRETTQDSVLKWKKDIILKSFFDKQLEISKKIIKESKPVLIVVLNAGSRELFKELYGNGVYDNRLGARIYSIGGKDTPVLFSGMLSGQRALDLGSQESLKWHIEYILKQIGYKPKNRSLSKL